MTEQQQCKHSYRWLRPGSVVGYCQNKPPAVSRQHNASGVLECRHCLRAFCHSCMVADVNATFAVKLTRSPL